MADVCGGVVRWQDEADPELRPLVVKQIEATLTGLCRALCKNGSPPENLNEQVADFEEGTFQTSKDMVDYMRLISIRISHGQKEVQLKTAADRQQQMRQMVHQKQLPNMAQAIQGINNSPFTSTPHQAVSMMAIPSLPPFQSPNQHMHRNVNHGPADMMPMFYQNFNSEPATVPPVPPSIKCSQMIMPSIAMQTESQFPAMQQQPTNIAQCYPASMVQLQGQQIPGPNGHQNHFLGQNVWDYVQHLQPTVQQEHFWITQQQMGMHMQRYQMLGADVGKMSTGYSCGWNNQHNAGWTSEIQSPSNVWGKTNMDSQPMPSAQSQNSVNQQNVDTTAHEGISQTRQNVVTTLSAGEKTHSNQLQGVASPCFSYKSPEPLQSSLSSNDIELCCTPSPISKFWVASPDELPKSTPQAPISMQGVVAAVSPCVSLKSSLTSAEKTGFEAPVSPCTLVKPASPSAMVQSMTVPVPLPSDSDSSVLLHNNEAVNGCKQATTTKLSTPATPADQAEDEEHGGAETPMTKTPAPPADMAEDQNHGGAETPSPTPPADQTEGQEHGGAESPGAKTPSPPSDQAEDQGNGGDETPVAKEHGGAETPVAKKPIDRLIAAVVSSSPSVVRSSANLMKWAVIDMDSVPLPIGINNKMKRVYNVTSTSKSPTLSGMDGSTVTFEFNASDAASSGYHIGKRHKPQNAKDALLDEIEAVNSRLIDTSISITSEDGADGITSCNGMTLIKLSYTAVSLAPGLKSKFGVSGNFQPLVMATTLAIPDDYPGSSPVIVDDEGDAQLRNKFSSISVAVDRAFRLALHNLQEPKSLNEIARVWDSCVRRAVTEYVYQLGGEH